MIPYYIRILKWSWETFMFCLFVVAIIHRIIIHIYKIRFHLSNALEWWKWYINIRIFIVPLLWWLNRIYTLFFFFYKKKKKEKKSVKGHSYDFNLSISGKGSQSSPSIDPIQFQVPGSYNSHTRLNGLYFTWFFRYKTPIHKSIWIHSWDPSSFLMPACMNDCLFWALAVNA